MGLPRRSFYHNEKEEGPDKDLEARIGDICLEFSGYGYRRVTRQLQREGRIVNHKKVSRIMREKGWSCRSRKKKWVTTTDSDHGFQVYPNLVKGIKINAINQVWVADITYIHILMLCLPGRYSRRLFEKGCRLCPLPKDRHEAGSGRFTYGHT